MAVGIYVLDSIYVPDNSDKLSPDQTWRRLLEDLFLTRPWTWALSLAHSLQFGPKKKKAFRVSLVKILPTLDTLLKFPIPHSSQLITLACLQQDSCWIRLAKIHLALMFAFSNFLSTDSQSCSLVINPHFSSFYSDLSSVSFPFFKKVFLTIFKKCLNKFFLNTSHIFYTDRWKNQMRWILTPFIIVALANIYWVLAINQVMY